MAVVAPMPSPSMAIARSPKPGDRRKERTASLTAYAIGQNTDEWAARFKYLSYCRCMAGGCAVQKSVQFDPCHIPDALRLSFDSLNGNTKTWSRCECCIPARPKLAVVSQFGSASALADSGSFGSCLRRACCWPLSVAYSRCRSPSWESASSPGCSLMVAPLLPFMRIARYSREPRHRWRSLPRLQRIPAARRPLP
jgi:hypothetical protein